MASCCKAPAALTAATCCDRLQPGRRRRHLGEGSIGLIAQSIGGGGSFAGTSLVSAGGTGNAAAIGVELNGSIATMAAARRARSCRASVAAMQARSAYAQTGNVTTEGDGATGITAQSLGDSGSAGAIGVSS